ncbi:galactose-specific lectin nattectin-like [Genypterus blacodes]|uniref:galactose-specific lectin nattectin-like n=1 Tax=Genypterus blacodes TaxID=154954 RepID=UPI003F75E0C5
MASVLHLITLISVALFASAQGSMCPCGWSQFKHYCYLLRSSVLNMPDAEADCLSRGGHLASYHSNEEAQFVINLFKKSGEHDPRTWTGLHDALRESLFFYTDGSVFSYKPWANGEPNNLHEEDCVEMYASGHFNDISCAVKRKFVCSIHL